MSAVRRRGHVAWSMGGVLGLALLAASVPASPVAAAPTAAEAPALEAFGECLAVRKTGDVLVLVDESGSLRRNDPEAVRVSAAQYLLERFADLADAQDLDLAVSTAGFSADFRPALGWTDLGADSLGGVTSGLEDFASRDDGLDTDYWNALDGARRTMADRARERREASPAGTCQAVVWLSDGALDIEARNGSDDAAKVYAPGVDLGSERGAGAAEKLARESLCSTGGLADQLRGERVYVFGVGLEAPDDPPDFGLFQSLATGQTDGGTCGAPVERPVGDFYTASTLTDLLLVFNLIGAGGDLLEQSTPVCGGAASEVCAHSFVLDDSIGSVRLLAATGGPSIQLALAAHDQPPTPLPPPGSDGTVDVGGLPAPVTWESDQVAALELTRPASGPWTGQWSLYFIDPAGTDSEATARSQLEIVGDLVPAWPDAETTELVAGEQADVQLALTRAGTDEQVDPTALRGEASLTAELVASDGSVVTLLEQVDATEPIPSVDLALAGVPPGDGVVRMVLSVTTAAVPAQAGRSEIPGTRLADQAVAQPVVVRVPARYPQVPALLDLGDQGETSVLRGDLEILGPGCVFVRDATVRTLPQGSGSAEASVDASDAGSCVAVAEGESGALPLEIVLGTAGTGTVAGDLVVVLVPEGGGDPIEQSVRFTGEVLRPLDPVTTVWVLALALLLGLGLPLLVAQIARHVAARIPDVPFLVHDLPVTVADGAVLRDGSPLALDPRGGQLVAVPKGARRLALPTGAVLSSRTGWDLRRVAHVVVDASGADTVAPPALRTTKRGVQASLPLDVQNRWFAVLGNSGVRVVAMPVGAADADALRQLVDDIAYRLPPLVERWRESSGIPEQEPPWAGAPPPQGGAQDWFEEPSAPPAPAPAAARRQDGSTESSWWNE